MRSSVVASLIWAVLFSVFARSEEIEDETVEGLFQRSARYSLEGNHEEALDCFVRLIKLGEIEDRKWDGLGETQWHLLFFDLGLLLLPLDRWEEAKYCFKRCVIEGNSEEELVRLFGKDFSSENWFRENRLADQPFYVAK